MTDESTVEEPEGPVIAPPYEGASALAIDELGPNGLDEPEPAPEDTEPEEPEADGEEKDKPPGWDQVDFATAKPEEIQARFNRIFGQMKRDQALMDQMARDQRALYEKIQNFEVAQTQTNVNAHMTSLQSQLQEAMDEGDATRTSTIIRQISQLEAKSANPGQAYTQTQQPPAQQQVPDEHPDVQAIREWSDEREWARDGGESHSWAAFQLNKLYTLPDWKARPVNEKLAEVDRLYGEFTQPAQQQAQPAQPAVLDQGGQTRRRSSGKLPNLTPEQKAVAVRMFADKSQKEAYEAYAKGLA